MQVSLVAVSRAFSSATEAEYIMQNKRRAVAPVKSRQREPNQPHIFDVVKVNVRLIVIHLNRCSACIIILFTLQFEKTE